MIPHLGRAPVRVDVSKEKINKDRSTDLHIAVSTTLVKFANYIIAAFAIGFAMSDDIIEYLFGCKQGTIRVPEGPGLGVELDSEKLEECVRPYEELVRQKPVPRPPPPIHLRG